MAQGRKSALRLSGSSVRPAYPGFMEMNTAHVVRNRISVSSYVNVVSRACPVQEG